jgi:hypothetical protein
MRVASNGHQASPPLSRTDAAGARDDNGSCKRSALVAASGPVAGTPAIAVTAASPP